MPTPINRRRALQTLAGATAAAAVTGLYAWQIEPHWLEITHTPLPLPGLPPQLEGKTLAHLSDIHIGPQVSDEYLLDTFRRVRDLRPDFVVMTGDWVSYHGPRQLDQLRALLPQFPRGRVATLGSLGNHDYGHNWEMSELADEISSSAGRAGITMLRDQTADFSGLQFVGLEDMWGPYFEPQRVLSRTIRGGAVIALSHNPDTADLPIWGEFHGWILSGHTHGGQCRPPFLPPPDLPVQNRRYVAGAYELPQGRKMYISRGVGHLLQVRFNVRPEVAVFHLEQSRDSKG